MRTIRKHFSTLRWHSANVIVIAIDSVHFDNIEATEIRNTAQTEMKKCHPIMKLSQLELEYLVKVNRFWHIQLFFWICVCVHIQMTGSLHLLNSSFYAKFVVFEMLHKT